MEKMRKLVGALTPVADMAVLLDMPEGELRDELADPLSPAGKAYRRARAEAALQMRLRDIAFASDPESPARTAAAANVAAYYAQMTADEP